MRLALLMLMACAAAGATGCRHNLACQDCGGTRIGNGAVLAAVKQRICPHCGGGCEDGQCGLLGRLRGGAGALAGGCGPNGCGHGAGAEATYPPGPPTAAYAYPYYTVRGPRDFLQDNPMGIGPW